MARVFATLFFSLACLLSSGQNLKLTQPKLKDDFLIQNGEYAIYFHKQDVLQALTDIDKKLNVDNSQISKEIADGTLKQIDLTDKSSSDSKLVSLINSSLGCYLLLKGKAAVYKGNMQLKEISMEEAPPEADLDGTMSNIFFFSEVGSTNWVFHGGLRTELK